jgi:hypothetical protein
VVIPVGPRAPIPSPPLCSSHLAQATEATTAHLSPPYDRLENGPPPLAVHGVVRASPQLFQGVTGVPQGFYINVARVLQLCYGTTKRDSTVSGRSRECAEPASTYISCAA